MRVDGDRKSTIVDPGGMDVHTTGGIDQWLDRVRQGTMAEISQGELLTHIADWNQSHSQQLRLP